MSEHARLAPSAAHRNLRCVAALAMEERSPPQKDSEWSKEGTCAHHFAALTLKDGDNFCEKYIGQKAPNGWECTEEMSDHVQVYVDRMLEYAEDNHMFIEQRVSIEHLTGEKDAGGTADGIIITQDLTELQLHDFKYGIGVKVYSEENEQLMEYALGALEEYSMIFSDLERVRLVIHQPRLNHLDEWVCSIKELREFGKTILPKAQQSFTIVEKYKDKEIPEEFFSPGKETCRWCRAKGTTCKRLDSLITENVGMKFDDLTLASEEQVQKLIPVDTSALASKMAAIEMIEYWCKGVRAEVERVLFAGHKVTGYKVVQGKKGNRAWEHENNAESVLLNTFGKASYKPKELISPAEAEKLAKKKKLDFSMFKVLITQKEGKPSVAPESDDRPALSVDKLVFEDETGNDLI